MHLAHDPLHILGYDIKDKKELYIHAVFRLLGGGLIVLFIPALLYAKFGFGLDMIFLYYAITSCVISSVLILFSAGFLARFGSKINIIIGIIFLILNNFVFLFMGGSLFFLFLSAVLSGLFTVFFWPAFHYEMIDYSKSSQSGKKVAFLNIIATILGAISPLIGGMMIQYLGSGYVVYLGNFLILLSLIPILLTGKRHYKSKLTIDHQIKKIKKSFFSKMSLSFVGLGYAQFIGTVVWPLLIFIFFKDYAKVGGLVAISTLLVVFFIYYVGKISDNHQERGFLKFNLILQSFNWVLVVFSFLLSFFSSILIFMIDSIHKFTNNINMTLLDKALYDEAGLDTKKSLEDIVLHEISINFSRGIYCFIFYVLFHFTNNSEAMLIVPVVILLFFIPFQFMLYRK